MITNWRGRLRPRTDRSGQAVVEFALIAPILLLLVFGLIDFARAWSAHHVIADAAREGARIVVIEDGNDVAEATATVQTRLATAGLDVSEATIWFTPAARPNRGDDLTIDIEYDFQFWLIGPLMKWVSGQETATLASRITMRTE